MRSRWRTYGPTFQWTRFRLVAERSNGKWQPIRLTQIVGGRWWSLSIARLEPVQSPSDEPDPIDGAMHSVWLHGKWHWLTRKMTTPQREAAADAVQRSSDWLNRQDDELPRSLDLRWWRTDQPISGTATYPKESS